MPAISLLCLHLDWFLSYHTRADSSDSQMSDASGMTGMFLRLVSLPDIISRTLLTSRTNLFAAFVHGPHSLPLCLWHKVVFVSTVNACYFLSPIHTLLIYNDVEQGTLLETLLGLPRPHPETPWPCLLCSSMCASFMRQVAKLVPLGPECMSHMHPQGNCKPSEGRNHVFYFFSVTSLPRYSLVQPSVFSKFSAKGDSHWGVPLCRQREQTSGFS